MSDDSMSEDMNDKVDLPVIYVDAEFLPKRNGNFYNNGNTIFDKVYEINGVTYHEEQIYEGDSFQKFEIRTDDDNNVTLVTATDDTDESSSQYLDVSIQKTPYGIIINSVLFVTELQWHAIMWNGNVMICQLCDVEFDTPEEHIKLDTHIENLDKCKPLNKFDFHITRKIGDNYHCIICNVIFDSKLDTYIHLDSKEHEEKMLYATNRAFDILFDSNIHKVNRPEINDYHFDRNRLYSTSDASNDGDIIDGFYDYVTTSNDSDSNNVSYAGVSDVCMKSYASVAKKPAIATKYIDQVLTDRKVKIKFDSYHMIVTPRQNEFYCMVCVGFDHISLKAKHCLEREHLEKLSRCTIVDMYKKYYIRKVNDKYYHCGHCNTLIYIPDIENHVSLIHDRKKIKITDSDVNNSSKVINNIDNRVIVNNDAAGNDTAPSDDSSTHDNNHDSNEQQIKINAVKVMDDESNKNHLQIDQDINRLVNQDMNQFGNGKESNNNMQIDQKKNMNHESNQNHEAMNRKANLNLMQMNQSAPGMLSCQYININVFSCLLHVQLISFNMIYQRENYYYCGVCNYSSYESIMLQHINDVRHIERLNQLPFNIFFNINLIRVINTYAHCTICNVVFGLPLINSHVLDQVHRTLLSRAIVPNGLIPVPFTKQPSPLNQPIIESKSAMNQVEMNESNENEKQKMALESYDKKHIYIQFKNKYIKVTFKSFNSLFSIGDGSYYCFVCSRLVFTSLKDHIRNEDHVENLDKCHFIDKYDKHILRQISHNYHCCTCNIMFTKSELNVHMAWTIAQNKVDKKARKNDFKIGLKKIIVKTKQETVLTPEVELESNIKILLRIEVKPASNIVEVKKTNKVIIFDGKSVKVSWDAWQGLNKNKNGYRCLICQRIVKAFEINSHIAEEIHKNVLNDSIQRKLLPSLIRKVNENLVNCVTCNMEVSSKDHILSEHIKGKRHKKNLIVVKQTKLEMNDSNQDFLYL